MTKALGFLTGVCLTATVFFLMLDGPQHRQSDQASPAVEASGFQPMNIMSSATDDVSFDAESRTANSGITDKGNFSVNSATPFSSVVETATVATDSSIPPLRTLTEDDTGPLHLNALQTFADQSTTAGTQPIEARAESMDSPAPDPEQLRDTGNSDSTHSHVFWSPFRSEWAAKGFAGRLTNATQITVKVVDVGSGKYRAAFDYQDEIQRLENIERIQSITGLKLE